MATSKYTKRCKAVRRIASGTAVGGGSLRMQLNRDWLISEHRVDVLATQTYAGGAPTSIDVRDFIATVSVETSDGRRVFLTGAQAYDLGRFTEAAAAVTNSALTTGVNTSKYSFDIHFENDEAMLDLLTALRSNELTTLDLVLTFNIDTANGFKGGTSATAATYAVTVESGDYEMLAETQFGHMLGSAKHYAEKQSKVGTTTGAQPDLQLVTGNITRFLMLHAYDTTGVATLSDAILGNLRLNINGRDFRVTTGFDTQQSNVKMRGFNQTGVVCIDFGDDENGWLDLRNVNQALLQWEVLAGAPASYRVDLAQDYTRSSVQ